MIIIISAPSGSGKSTIINEMLRRGLPLGFSISATSRPPRGNEQDGVEYHFLSTRAFQDHIAAGDFLEYEEVYAGRYYGTLRSEIERIKNEGKIPVFDVDVKGAMNIKKSVTEPTLTLFIQPPSIEVLRERLIKRATDAPEVIEQRLERASFEMTYASKFDCIVVNDNLTTACDETFKIITDFIAKN